jgi:DNA-directed RNA polymerase subunit M/transcription elongation factor TFIIS
MEDLLECPGCGNTMVEYMRHIGKTVHCLLCGEEYPVEIENHPCYPDKDEEREALYRKGAHDYPT